MLKQTITRLNLFIDRITTVPKKITIGTLYLLIARTIAIMIFVHIIFWLIAISV